MNILMFGGQSLSNRDWMVTLSSELNTRADNYEFLYHEYLAWSSKPNSDDASQIKNEIISAQSMYRNCNFDIIIGKSFGCLIALESKASCRYIILVGPPVMVFKQMGFDLMKAITASHTKVLILANNDDPLIDRVDLEGFARKNPRLVNFHTLTGNQHKYDNIEELTQFINNFIML